MRLSWCLVIAGLAGLMHPSPVEACSCGVGSSPPAAALQGLDVVFVGTVAQVEGRKPWSRVNSDGSISGGMGNGPTIVTFNISRLFRGDSAGQIAVVGDGTSCDQPFKHGEAWLVYARTREGRVTTTECTRTRLLADAGEDVKYLEGIELGRPQAVLHGLVLRERLDAAGHTHGYGLSEPLDVIAAGPGQLFAVKTEERGPYQLVLPPGDFDVWGERDGQVVTPRTRLRLEKGDETRLILLARFD
jgi:hypothetical protein